MVTEAPEKLGRATKTWPHLLWGTLDPILHHSDPRRLCAASGAPGCAPVPPTPPALRGGCAAGPSKYHATTRPPTLTAPVSSHRNTLHCAPQTEPSLPARAGHKCATLATHTRTAQLPPPSPHGHLAPTHLRRPKRARPHHSILPHATATARVRSPQGVTGASWRTWACLGEGRRRMSRVQGEARRRRGRR